MATEPGDRDRQKRRPRGRFQVSLLQLLLVTLTVGTVVWLNVEFRGFEVDEIPWLMRPYSRHGCPFVFYLVEQERESSTVEEETDFDGPVAEEMPYTGDRTVLPIGLFVNGMCWLGAVVLAWMIGDQSSLPRSVRDRLRKVRRRVGMEDGT